MRLLLTGVCGFLAGYLARLASEFNYEVHGIDLTPDGDRKASLYKYYRVDAGRENFQAIVEQAQPDLCIHTAGRASVAGSMSDPADDFCTGPVLTFALLEALRENAPQCRFILLSSAAVYGNPTTLPVSEEQEPSPISPYGFHKLQCELLCREYAQIFGLHTAAVRIFSAYGEGLRRQVLWDMCRQLVTSGTLMLRGTGKETRDFIHAMDIAFAVLQVANRARMCGEVYNVASGRETSVCELARLAAGALQPGIHPCFDGNVPLGDPLHWKADIRKIKDLGFTPSLLLEDGVTRYALWCKQQLLKD